MLCKLIMRPIDSIKETIVRLLSTCTILSLLLCVLTTASVAESRGSEALARKLINAQGCKACHTLGGAGGPVAVSLEEAGLKLTPDEIRQQLTNQERQHGDGRIPDFGHLSAREIEALVKFLKQIP